MMQVYHGLFTSKKDVEREFDTTIPKVTIIYAGYDNDNYNGHAFVLFIKTGVIFEVNGSHCSCNGLEGQWNPEENDYASLIARPNVPQEAKNNLKKYFRIS
jgi:hypothetical protein